LPWVFGICNHCGIMTAWSQLRKTGKFWAIFAFFGKTTPSGKIFKILFRKFPWRHRLTVLFKCREIFPTGNRWNCALFTAQKNFKISNCPYFRYPKSARASPHHLAHIVPNFIQIGSLSAELAVIAERVNLREGRSFGP